MRLSKIYAIFFFTPLFCGTAYAEQPTYTAMAKVAEAMGETVTDFYVCDAIFEARTIRKFFFDTLPVCNKDSGNVRSLQNVLDRSAAKRNDEIERHGKQCKSDISARYNFVMKQISALEDSCK